MMREIAYMLGVVAAGFAVNYMLRALPFVIFAGRDRALPPWIERFGKFVSPVIIALLVFYAYSGLAWKTAWPYLAGVLTVALQLWRRNPLVSIVAGTALYMALASCCGCVSDNSIELDAKNPAIAIRTTGVYFGEEPVSPEDVPGLLRDAGVARDRTIHIFVESELRELKTARSVMGYLAKAGYTRPILVTKRHAEAIKAEPKDPRRKLFR